MNDATNETEVETKLYREVARAIFAVNTGEQADKPDAGERQKKWDAEKKERVQTARQIVRRMREKGITVSMD